MNKKNIQSILLDVLEEEIPSSEVNLWPAVKANLIAGQNQQKQQGDKMNTVRPRRVPRFALAISLLIVLAAIFLATPQGRSFAQSVLELFTRSESTVFPLEDSQIMPQEPDQHLPTALPPAPLISVAEAKAQVDFNIVVLPDVPKGLDYLGVRLYGNTVNIEYQTQNMDGHLSIKQSQEGYYQSDWGNVPAEAVVPVKIGELNGEFAKGTFVVYPEDSNATWNPDTSHMRLRWVEDDIWFEITKYGEAQEIQYLDMAGLIEIAKSLTIE